MKKFIIKIFQFTILLTISAYILGYLLNKGIEKLGDRDTNIWDNIIHSRIHSNVIINGSSRVWVHISPQILDSLLHVDSYNLGIDGYPFNMQDVRFKIFEKYNKKPQLIIQSADLNTLYRRSDPYNKSQFFNYMREPLLQDELIMMKGFSSFDFYIPALCYRSNLLSIYDGLTGFLDMKHYNTEGVYKGYKGQDQKWNGIELEKILSGDSLVSEIDPKIVQQFDFFLNYCKGNNIQVIMVFPPEYIKATEFTKNKQEVIDIYRSFSKKYDFSFLDYSTDSLCYDTTYFYNAQHLNKTGAELFSTKLAHDIDSLGILKKK